MSSIVTPLVAERAKLVAEIRKCQKEEKATDKTAKPKRAPPKKPVRIDPRDVEWGPSEKHLHGAPPPQPKKAPPKAAAPAPKASTPPIWSPVYLPENMNDWTETDKANWRNFEKSGKSTVTIMKEMVIRRMRRLGLSPNWGAIF